LPVADFAANPSLLRLPETIHLHPTASLAERVLLPGDPGRALLLAQALLQAPRMFNHNRGLWGYTGNAADGEPLTIQSTGMGGPSAAIVIAELAELGAQRLLRVGTCGALGGSLELGELALASNGAARSGAVVSTDLFYDSAEGSEQRWSEQGALAVEMETATLFTLAARRGLQAGAVLIVTDMLIPARRRIETELLRSAERRSGELAARALAR
jgi:uridine phosphorylase